MQSPHSVYVIAELCSNAAPFDGARLEAFCRAAAYAGADAVKVQLLPEPNHFPGFEQETKGGRMCPPFRIAALAATAEEIGLQWGFSVFSRASLRDAIQKTMPGPNFLKLASREYHNTHLARAVIATDIWCLRSVPLGARPILGGTWRLETETILDCDDTYPSSIKASEITGPFGGPGPDGWSSHTRGWEDVIAAVRAGAMVIEKHLKLSDEDPEAEWSLSPQQFAEMVKQIREAEK